MSKGLYKQKGTMTLPLSLNIPQKSLFRGRSHFPLQKKAISMPPTPIELSPESHFPDSQIFSPKVTVYSKLTYSGPSLKISKPLLPSKLMPVSPIFQSHMRSPTHFLPDLPRLCGRSPSSLSHNPPDPENVIAKVSYKTRTGEISGKPKKQNQDSYVCSQLFGPNTGFFAVCDGHGTYGHEVSAYIRETLPKEVVKVYLAAEENGERLQQAMEIGMKKVADRVTRCRVDTTFSGSTCVSVGITGRTLVCGNVGDSRAIIIRREGDSWTFRELSRDHKPESPREKARIMAMGGRVSPFLNESGVGIGPQRVWIKNEDIPGLAMSRSLGDAVAHSVGVSSSPEIFSLILSPADHAVVIASDGLWEFLSNEEVTQIAMRHGDDLEHALEALTEEALNRWRKQDECIDDITIVLVLLQVPSL